MHMLQCMSPLVAQSRHLDRADECPLSGVKRTSKFKSVTSAFDPFETWATKDFRGAKLVHPASLSVISSCPSAGCDRHGRVTWQSTSDGGNC
jgi:hypothetical protein